MIRRAHEHLCTSSCFDHGLIEKTRSGAHDPNS
jgi:hypothetical protein